MDKAPQLWTLKSLTEWSVLRGIDHGDGKGWVPARPIGLDTIPNRIRCAWMVFTGRADAVVWPGGQ